MRDRRRKKDEPFNPFQANANAVRQKRRNSRIPGYVPKLREKIRSLESELIVSIFPPWVSLNSVLKKRNERTQQQGTSSSTPVRPAHRTQNMESDLLKKQREAREKLTISSDGIVSGNKTPPSTQPSAVKTQSRAERLAELRKQSQESIKKTESILGPANHRPLAIKSDLLKKQKEVREKLTVSEKQTSSEIKSAEREKNRSPPKLRKMSRNERKSKEKEVKIRNLEGQISALKISNSSRKGRQRSEAEKKIQKFEKELENLR